MQFVRFSTKNEVLGRLKMAGLNMKEFAEAEGYSADTVRKVIDRYAGSGKTPRGAIARQILQKLEGRLRAGGAVGPPDVAAKAAVPQDVGAKPNRADLMRSRNE